MDPNLKIATLKSKAVTFYYLQIYKRVEHGFVRTGTAMAESVYNLLTDIIHVQIHVF